jgi:hypothetical protein
MSEGFLGRWSRRKEALREGKPVEAEPAVAQPVVAPAAGDAPPAEATPAPVEEAPPAPTLEDAKELTPQSDFRRFVAADVPAEVKNTALKKLFADPHFNVMDRLDVYIDDYSLPDPIPESMMRQLASAKFLNLFEEKKEEGGEAPEGREVADKRAAQSVAQSEAMAEPEVPPTDPHADPDLRLQQDDAPGPAGPGEGPR